MKSSEACTENQGSTPELPINNFPETEILIPKHGAVDQEVGHLIEMPRRPTD